MAFGILHFTFLVTGIIVLGCFTLLTRRYLEQRNALTLVFILFLLVYAANAFVFVARGLFPLQSLEDILLWRITNVLYPAMTVPIFFFFAYPVMLEKKGTNTGTFMKIGIIASFIIIPFNWIMIAISDVVHTYDDLYGLSHYRLESVVPGTYYLTLFLVVLAAVSAAILLGVIAYREVDSFYRKRALLLMVGWLLVVFGQLLLLSATLAIIHPVAAISGVVLMAIGVLKRKD